jgi:hypothetical protein
MKKHNIVSNIVQLSIEDIEGLPKEVVAAISRNPTLKWIKFVLTDDSPNANNQQIPREEFANLIKTGIHMPIKMAQGFIREGHEFAIPIGSITNLIEREHTVEGIAGLWKKEFPDEVDLLQERASSDNKPQLSWELLYRDSTLDSNDVEVFEGVSLSAATFVESPAYEGRTPVVVMASKDKTSDADYKIVTEEYNIMEEQLKLLQSQVETLLGEKDTLVSELATLKETFDALEAEKGELASANEELSEFKAGVESAEALKAKLAALTELFAQSDVSLPADYLEDDEKREKLLAMNLNEVEFLIQELQSFPKEDGAGGEEEAGKKKHLGSKEAPNVGGDADVEWTPEEIAEAMRKDREEKK